MAEASGSRVIDGYLEPNGYQQLTSLSAAATLTVPAGTKLCIIQCESQAVRYRDDGTAPTATVGMPLAVGAIMKYNSNATVMQFIEQTTSAKLNVLYYK